MIPEIDIADLLKLAAAAAVLAAILAFAVGYFLAH